MAVTAKTAESLSIHPTNRINVSVAATAAGFNRN